MNRIKQIVFGLVLLCAAPVDSFAQECVGGVCNFRGNGPCAVASGCADGNCGSFSDGEGRGRGPVRRGVRGVGRVVKAVLGRCRCR